MVAGYYKYDTSSGTVAKPFYRINQLESTYG